MRETLGLSWGEKEPVEGGHSNCTSTLAPAEPAEFRGGEDAYGRSLASRGNDGVACRQLCGGLGFEADNDGQPPKVLKVVENVGSGVGFGDK